MSSLDIILPRFCIVFCQKCVNFDKYRYTLKYPLCQSIFHGVFLLREKLENFGINTKKMEIMDIGGA